MCEMCVFRPGPVIGLAKPEIFPEWEGMVVSQEDDIQCLKVASSGDLAYDFYYTKEEFQLASNGMHVVLLRATPSHLEEKQHRVEIGSWFGSLLDLASHLAAN